MAATVYSTSPKMPPGPPRVGGNIIAQVRFGLQFQNQPLELLADWHRNYGDVFQLQIGSDFMQYFFIHPDDVQDVLVRQASSFQKSPDYRDEARGLARFLGQGLLTSDGEFWKRQRQLAQPAFHTKRIEAYAATMVDYTQRMLDSWQPGTRRDITSDMMRLTRLIVAKTLFDADVSADSSSQVDEVLNVFMHMANDVDVVPNWVPTPKHLRERRALQNLDDVVYGFIADWRVKSEDRGDLLSMLMLAEDEDGNGMTDQQLRDEIVTIFLAGHETTANALNWTFYLLAQHPTVSATLVDELDHVLGDNPPTLADLRQLPYTDMVIKESMRLYPPAWGLGRQTIEDVEVGGYPVAAGRVVSIVPYLTHRDPRWWPEAESFKPERFEDQPPKYTYIPFGGGPRVCIGNSFAMMEARLLLATIAQRFTLELEPGQIVKPEPLITLRPKNGLPMWLEAR